MRTPIRNFTQPQSFIQPNSRPSTCLAKSIWSLATRLVCLVALIASVVGLSLSSASAASASGAFVLESQGACNGWGNVILPGSAYAPGIANAPSVYGNLYGGSCANGYIAGTSAFGYEHQCTEFAVHWAASVWNVNPNSWRSGGGFVDAEQMWSQAKTIPGLVTIPNGAGAPQAGDLIVFTDSSVGHVAVVAGVTGSSLYFVGQNQGEAEQHITIANGNDVSPSTASSWLGVRGSVLGWVRSSNSGGASPSSGTDRATAVVDPTNGVLIYFRGTDGLLHQTHWVSTQWVTDTPTTAPVAGNPTVIDTPSSGPLVYFRGTDGLLHQTHYVSGTGWFTDSPSSTPMAGDPTAVVDPTNGVLIYFRGTDGLLHQTHWVSTQWVTDTPTPTATA